MKIKCPGCKRKIPVNEQNKLVRHYANDWLGRLMTASYRICGWSLNDVEYVREANEREQDVY